MAEEKDKQLKSETAVREEKILDFWQKEKIFEKTLTKDAPLGNFVFFDGPPFATGLPHYGHILAGTIKDVIPRYQTMKGKRVLRRWGWDCHGLPIENLIEKELDLKTKKDIEILGVGKFNQAARNAVMRYRDEWTKIIPRMGRWVDMENDYKTMDKTYTESVWWSFKTLNEKGLVYKGFKTMQICPRCGTTLSNFEVNQGYKDITDISVYVKFELVDEPGTFLLAWTTTPWTLPGNVALAVGADVEYWKVSILEDTEGLLAGTYIFAKDAVLSRPNVPEVLHKLAVLGENGINNAKKIVIRGSDLVGRAYKPIFDYYNTDTLKHKENAWKVYAGDFVTTDAGTGIVHIAPAFGEDDLALGQKYSLPFIQHVGFDGIIKPEVVDFSGLDAKPKNNENEKDAHQKTDIEVIKVLAGKGVLFSKEKIIHSYPHCWRCETPLLNYATSSWFVKVTDLKEKMFALNEKVQWIPETIGSGRFGKWIEGARDWSVSRARYWGAPLPVWESADGERLYVGSVSELKSHIEKRNNFFLVRHGESEGNASGDRISSNLLHNDPLTELGRKEVQEAGVRLKDLAREGNNKIDVIIASPFVRTKETARIIAETIGYAEEIIEDPRLVEINTGSFDGKPWSEFMAQFASAKERFTKHVDGAENWGDVRKRVCEAMYDINTQYEGKNILIVSHGAPLHLIALASLGYSTEEIIEHYYDDAFMNAEVKEVDWRNLPHNEDSEIDLHRPYIDDIVLISSKNQPMRRVSEVFDTWYDSGSMPFAQQHYPFENRETFEGSNSPLFPADFIAEGLDQTRGWFYTLLVLGAGLFELSPYNNVIVNGLVLAEDGRKMSKSLKNYPDVMDVVNTYGADAVRYYMVASPIVKAEDLNFSTTGVDEVHKKITGKLVNILSFYEMYKKDTLEKGEATILDQWIMSRFNKLRDEVTKSLDLYELDRASRPILEFIDDFSTWYVRRSRDRFKSDDVFVSGTALWYTAHVLKELSKVIAPFMPFIAEHVYQAVRAEGDTESVHLASWPVAGDVNNALLTDMQKVREVVSNALQVRSKANIKVRQPLASLVVKQEFNEELRAIIADEVNVKEVASDTSMATELELDITLTPDLIEEGVARDIIRAIQDARKKEDLTPNQSVALSISGIGTEFLNRWGEMIQKPTGVTSIEVVETPAPGVHTLTLDNLSISFSLSLELQNLSEVRGGQEK